MNSDDRIVVYPRESVGASASWLVDEIKRQGIPLDPGSPLAADLEILREAREDAIAHKDRVRANSLAALQERFRRGCGVDFMSKVLHRANAHFNYSPNRKLLASLARYDCNPLVPMASAVAGDPKSRQARDMVLELLAAAVCSPMGPAEHCEPPDVTCVLHSGLRVGIACKHLYSQSDRNRWSRITEGLEQCARRPDLDIEIVLVNAVEFAPLESWLLRSGAMGFLHSDLAVKWAQDTVKDFCKGESLRYAFDAAESQCQRTGREVAVVFFFPMVLYLNEAVWSLPLLHMGFCSPGGEQFTFDFQQQFNTARGPV